MNLTGPNHKLGILGGGQLGRMFIQEAISYDIQVHIMDAADAPSSAIANTFTVGDITNYEDVMKFGSNLNTLTVEIENVNIEALFELESLGVNVYPQPRVLKIIKDKGIQKEFYTKNNIPTSPFYLAESQNEIKKSFPFVQKLRTGGYDGKGVQVIDSEKDWNELFSEPSVIEEKIPFVKELSVIVARNEAGQTKVYPTVECEFNNVNLVSFLFSPAEISSQIEEKAKKLAIQVIDKLGMVGILAVELFLMEDGSLYVNEVAPRPHNSGHHTIECNVTSQFEQHMRSVLNLPLGSTEMTQIGAMINLIGEKNHTGPVKYQGLVDILQYEKVHPHFYGKKETKPNRKMGHITITGTDLMEVKEKAKAIKSKIIVISE